MKDLEVGTRVFHSWQLKTGVVTKVIDGNSVFVLFDGEKTETPVVVIFLLPIKN